MQALRFNPPNKLVYKDQHKDNKKSTNQKDETFESVFKVGQDGKIEKLRISVGLSDGKYIEVINGANEFDEIILREQSDHNIQTSGSGFSFKFR